MAVQTKTAEKQELNQPTLKVVPSEGAPDGTHTSIGTFLKRARQSQKMRIDNIANELHIRSDYLAAIEENVHQDLPEPVYVMGYIRSYAAYLGLDPHEAIRLYKLEEKTTPAEMNLFFPKAVERKSLPRKSILIASTALLMTLATGWVINQRDNTIDAPIEGEAMSTLQKTSDSPPAIDTPVIAQKITMEALDDVWIEIRNKSDKILVSKTLKKNDRYEVPNEENLILSTGNAAGLQIQVGETVIPSFGPKGATRRNISLDGKKLLQGTPTP